MVEQPSEQQDKGTTGIFAALAVAAIIGAVMVAASLNTDVGQTLANATGMTPKRVQFPLLMGGNLIFFGALIIGLAKMAKIREGSD